MGIKDKNSKIEHNRRIRVGKISMKCKIIRKVSSFLIIVFTLLNVTSSFLYVVGCDVVTDLYKALEEMEYLEKKDLLSNPPDNISLITKREIKLCQNSSVLKGDIRLHEVSLFKLEKLLPIYIILLILTVVMRVSYRKKRV